MNTTRNTIHSLRAALFALVVSPLLLPPASAAPAKSAPVKPASPVPLAPPEAWREADIGKVGVVGAARQSGGTWTITASGTDIFGPADSFHFVWRAWHGDGRITARVVRYQRRDMWTKVGVMARESRAAGGEVRRCAGDAGQGRGDAVAA